MKKFLPVIVLLIATGCATGFPDKQRNQKIIRPATLIIVLKMMVAEYIAFMTGAIMYISPIARVKPL